MNITSNDGAGRPCILVHSHNGQPVAKESQTFSRGVSYTVTGGRAPRTGGSTGRVWVESADGDFGEYFPSVFGMEWRVTDKLEPVQAVRWNNESEE